MTQDQLTHDHSAPRDQVTPVAIVHDYVTQRGGAERVVLAMTKAFPGAPIHTSLFNPATTFPEYASIDVRPFPMNSSRLLRERHRIALPFLAPAFSKTRVDARVVLCSSSGWAHGIGTDAPKVVYCHTPARWLYQHKEYLRGTSLPGRLAFAAMRPMLTGWDRRAARTANRYMVNSQVVAERVKAEYGIEAEVLQPPYAMSPEGVEEPLPDIEAGYLLVVSRLSRYKNVDRVVEAIGQLPDVRLVVAGAGPLAGWLRERAPSNVRLVGAVSDNQLRWLYRNARGLVVASYEDFGLTPLEAAAFGHPVAALRWGGFLDTVVEGKTGVFFEQPEPAAIAASVRELLRTPFDAEVLRAHADAFNEEAFVGRLREVVAEVAG